MAFAKSYPKKPANIIPPKNNSGSNPKIVTPAPKWTTLPKSSVPRTSPNTGSNPKIPKPAGAAIIGLGGAIGPVIPKKPLGTYQPTPLTETKAKQLIAAKTAASKATKPVYTKPIIGSGGAIGPVIPKKPLGAYKPSVPQGGAIGPVDVTKKPLGTYKPPLLTETRAKQLITAKSAISKTVKKK